MYKLFNLIKWKYFHYLSDLHSVSYLVPNIKCWAKFNVFFIFIATEFQKVLDVYFILFLNLNILRFNILGYIYQEIYNYFSGFLKLWFIHIINVV